MTENELNKILEDHEKWLEDKGDGVRADLRGSDLRRADLQEAYLRGADLRRANLDFSCLPLWCGSLKAHFDDKQVIQILYHLLSVTIYSKNVSDELKDTLLVEDLIKLANKFHRVIECGKIEGKK